GDVESEAGRRHPDPVGAEGRTAEQVVLEGGERGGQTGLGDRAPRIQRRRLPGLESAALSGLDGTCGGVEALGEGHAAQLCLRLALVAVLLFGVVERRGEGCEAGGEAPALLERGGVDLVQVRRERGRGRGGVGRRGGGRRDRSGRCPGLVGEIVLAVAELPHRTPPREFFFDTSARGEGWSSRRCG